MIEKIKLLFRLIYIYILEIVESLATTSLCRRKVGLTERGKITWPMESTGCQLRRGFLATGPASGLAIPCV